MLNSYFNDRQKLLKIIEVADINRSELARRLEVDYKTIYRWIDKDISPQKKRSMDIDHLFKSLVDLRGIVYELKAKSGNPLKLLRAETAIREQFFLDITYNSNAIEGSRMTRKETKDAFDGKNVRGKQLFEVLDAVNHRSAMEFVLDSCNTDFLITGEYVLSLHEKVMRGFSDKLPGKYRPGHVNPANAQQILPPASEVPLRMGKFLSGVNSYGEDIIENIALDHYEFEAIHPFLDGNGKVGRLIMLTQLLSKGLAPAIIKVEDRNKYYAALDKGDIGDLKNIVQLLCDAIIDGYGRLFAAEKGTSS